MGTQKNELGLNEPNPLCRQVTKCEPNRMRYELKTLFAVYGYGFGFAVLVAWFVLLGRHGNTEQ